MVIVGSASAERQQTATMRGMAASAVFDRVPASIGARGGFAL
jgi:hypothetical protein